MALEKYCKDSARDKINEALDGFIDDLCYTWKEGGRETGYIMVEWGREGWNGERRRKGRQNGATLESIVEGDDRARKKMKEFLQTSKQ